MGPNKTNPNRQKGECPLRGIQVESVGKVQAGKQLGKWSLGGWSCKVNVFLSNLHDDINNDKNSKICGAKTSTGHCFENLVYVNSDKPQKKSYEACTIISLILQLRS